MKVFPLAIPEKPNFGCLVKVFPNSMAFILKYFQKSSRIESRMQYTEIQI